jgi:hypothetical protein
LRLGVSRGEQLTPAEGSFEVVLVRNERERYERTCKEWLARDRRRDSARAVPEFLPQGSSSQEAHEYVQLGSSQSLKNSLLWS